MSFSDHPSTSSLSSSSYPSNGATSSNAAMSFASKSSRVGHSLLGAINTASLGMLRSSHNMVGGTNLTNALFQQQRTFIQMRTNLKVADNSGAKRVMCIQVLKGRRLGAVLGDTIVASVKEAFPRGKVKKGEVVYGVVVRAAMKHNRLDGSEIVFDDNAVVLVNKQGEPIGTRISGPVPYELRKKHAKILALADNVV